MSKPKAIQWVLVVAALVFSVSAEAADWQPHTSYAAGALVTFGGLEYRCVQAHTSQMGWEPPNVLALWNRVIAGDAWQPSTAFPRGQLVVFDGALYECLQAHVSQVGWEPPAVPALWRRVTDSCVVGPATLRFGVPRTGIEMSVWDDQSVSMTIPVENESATATPTVEITNVVLAGGSRLEPSVLPVGLGTIAPEQMAMLSARFRVPQIGPQFSYRLLVAGRARLPGGSCPFAVSRVVTPEARGGQPIVATAGTTPVLDPTTAFYPPPPPPASGEVEPEGVRNRPPLGPPRDFSVTPQAISVASEVTLPSAGTFAQAAAAVDPITIVRNTTIGTLPPANGLISLVPDPSAAGATRTGVSIFSANTGIGYSTDDGQSFTVVDLFRVTDPLNPKRTTFFPQDDGGLCCDQSVTYLPKQDLFVWLSLTWPAPITLGGKVTTGPNRIRIAWAKPADVARDFLHAWHFFDLTSAMMRFQNDWLDFPDIAFTDRFLYVAADHGVQGTPQTWGRLRLVVRMSLEDMVANARDIRFEFVQPSNTGLSGAHLVQSSADTMFWAAQSDTSTLTVFSWPDSAAEPLADDVAITRFGTSDFTVNDPNGKNWNAGNHRVLGATRTVFRDPSCHTAACERGFLYFAFDAGRNAAAGRPFPYVRVEKIDIATMTLAGELDLYNVGFGCACPALVSRPGPTSDLQVAATLTCAPDGGFAGQAVGFLGDPLYLRTTASEMTQAAPLGDFFHVRNSAGPVTPNGRGFGFSTLSYATLPNTPGQSCEVGGCRDELHYVLFGRQSELFPDAPQLTVTKMLEPSSDAGRFDLLVDGVVRKAGVGNGGTTGALTVSEGRHVVAEVAAAGTSLAGYDRFIAGDCAPNGSVTLAPGDKKTCTIINTAASQCAADCKIERDLCVIEDPEDTKLCVAQFLACLRTCP